MFPFRSNNSNKNSKGAASNQSRAGKGLDARRYIWSDAETEKNLRDRYQAAAEARRIHERQWRINEHVLYESHIEGGDPRAAMPGLPVGVVSDQGDEGDDFSQFSSSNYILKNFKTIHAQISANPPSVVMVPKTQDQNDHRAASAADAAGQFARTQYELQEQMDNWVLFAKTYGTGYLRILYNPDLGDLVALDPETHEPLMEGDLEVLVPHTKNIFLDPDATNTRTCKWAFERVYLDLEEAALMFPEARPEVIKAAKVDQDAEGRKQHNVGCFLLYFETGLKQNGFLGRHAVVVEATGKVVRPCQPSPCRYTEPVRARRTRGLEVAEMEGESSAQKIERAYLPYLVLTDVDVPGSLYGASFVEPAINLQENLARIDETYLRNFALHGVQRLLSHADNDVSLVNNTGVEVTVYKGVIPPNFLEVPQLIPDMARVRENLRSDIDIVMGMNEAMFGIQSRETAAASMQYAIQQGQLIHRRFFNKYVLGVQQLYFYILRLMVTHWDVAKFVEVLGKEKATEIPDLTLADLDGGYDVKGEYGTIFSLDPITRRQEILLYKPALQEAGVPARRILKALKLSELAGLQDTVELADKRQSEIFERIKQTKQQIAPEEQMDHENMIAYALEYFMTAEFVELEPEVQELLKEHNKARIALAAQERAALSAAVASTPGAAPAPAPGAAPGAAPAPAPAEGMS